MEDKIIMPMGWLAGRPLDIKFIIQMLQSEISGFAADLEHKAEQLPPLRQSYEDAKKTAADKEYAAKEAKDLRRYGWALWLIYWQLLTPEEKKGAVIDLEDLAGIARDYNLVLPEDLKKMIEQDE